MRLLLAPVLLALASCTRPSPPPDPPAPPAEEQPPPAPGPHPDLSLDWDRFACRYYIAEWQDYRRAEGDHMISRQALEVAELQYSRRNIPLLTLEQFHAAADAALEREERQLERLERLVKAKRRELETTHRSTP